MRLTIEKVTTWRAELSGGQRGAFEHLEATAREIHEIPDERIRRFKVRDLLYLTKICRTKHHVNQLLVFADDVLAKLKHLGGFDAAAAALEKAAGRFRTEFGIEG